MKDEEEETEEEDNVCSSLLLSYQQVEKRMNVNTLHEPSRDRQRPPALMAERTRLSLQRRYRIDLQAFVTTQTSRMSTFVQKLHTGFRRTEDPRQWL